MIVMLVFLSALKAEWTLACKSEDAAKKSLAAAISSGASPARVNILKWRVRAAWDLTEEALTAFRQAKGDVWADPAAYPEDEIAGFKCLEEPSFDPGYWDNEDS